MLITPTHALESLSTPKPLAGFNFPWNLPLASKVPRSFSSTFPQYIPHSHRQPRANPYHALTISLHSLTWIPLSPQKPYCHLLVCQSPGDPSYPCHLHQALVFPSLRDLSMADSHTAPARPSAGSYSQTCVCCSVLSPPAKLCLPEGCSLKGHLVHFQEDRPKPSTHDFYPVPQVHSPAPRF